MKDYNINASTRLSNGDETLFEQIVGKPKNSLRQSVGRFEENRTDYFKSGQDDQKLNI